MHRDTVRLALIAAVHEIKGVELPDMCDDILLELVQVDSLELVEIGMIVEMQLAVELDSTFFDGIRTFGDIVAAVVAQAS